MALLRLSGKTASAEEPRQGSGGGGMKSLVILLVVLDVIALGFFGYLKVIKRREVERAKTVSEREVRRIKEWGDEVAQQARRLAQERTTHVKEPANPITKVFTGTNLEGGGTLMQNVTISNAVPRTWSQNTNYEAWTINVTFLQKAGYRFKDIIGIARMIERQNPKVQVSAINFGKRRQGEGESEMWDLSRMEVRVFKPRRPRTE